MPIDTTEMFEELDMDAIEREERLVRLLSEVTFEEHSRDGVISVTCDGWGELVDIQLKATPTRASETGDFGQEIVDLAARAASSARQHQDELKEQLNIFTGEY
ncbi:hypothetical protein DZF91_01835 [Actinomadura logoneensis]|uniref:YbaB/EbfC family DNA-binding protein n=2 Tax=Actinomadura logoneensis TaxID=2293572 RepID=A0A372JTF4_9ACTN|nr:hypothetical protein DZF91_01835 [Actinomadura logoneensis]